MRALGQRPKLDYKSAIAPTAHTPGYIMLAAGALAVAGLVIALASVKVHRHAAAPTASWLSNQPRAAMHRPQQTLIPSHPVSVFRRAIQSPVDTLLSIPPPIEASSKAIIKLIVAPGDSLATLFDHYNLSARDLHEIMLLGPNTARLQHLQPGDTLLISPLAGGAIGKLNYAYSDEHRLVVTRTGTGRFESRILARPLQHNLMRARGTITSSLFNAAIQAGLSDSLTMQLVGVFGWDIDFVHDIHPGDHFSVVYQRLRHSDAESVNGPIMAASFTVRGKRYEAVRYTNPAGQSNYYTPAGKSMRKAFLRAPVAFTRISSRFTLHRKHPILGYSRAHKGVDYAAPTGTPIKAAGNGRIVYRGRKGGYGNCIVMQHGVTYSTVYGHMSRFKTGLDVGSYVRQGQVIGYVGMTGLATGPHLHFELRVNGVARNPRTVKLPNASPVAAKYREDFQRAVSPLLSELEATPHTHIAETGKGEADTVPPGSAVNRTVIH